ncbi:MAG: hypothetical protein NC416_18660 [Eubacterium sp.]|nr:hypothetical protein [Eubacterium sp.]
MSILENIINFAAEYWKIMAIGIPFSAMNNFYWKMPGMSGAETVRAIRSLAEISNLSKWLEIQCLSTLLEGKKIYHSK